MININFLLSIRHKKIFIFSILLIVVVSFVTIFSVHQSNASSESTQQIKAVFSVPLSVSEFVVASKQYSVKLVEFHYTQGDIQGGYTIQPGENINDSVKNFLNAHHVFLTTAINKTEKDISEAIDITNQQRLSVLHNQLISAQLQINGWGLKIDTITTNNRQSFAGLEKAGLIKSITSTRQNVMESRENFGSEGIGIMSLTHEPWAPYGGTSDVQRTYTYQTFYFNNVSNYGSADTYEHETQVYNKNFADYAGYWSSNMPSAYYDTPFSDSIDNFTIGTFTGSSLRVYTQYYAYMSLRAGSASTATVRIKGQKGHRYPSWCYSTWCVFADATTGSMATFTAPAGMSWQY